MFTLLKNLGKYFIMMNRVMSRPEKYKVFWKPETSIKQTVFDVFFIVFSLSNFSRPYKIQCFWKTKRYKSMDFIRFFVFQCIRPQPMLIRITIYDEKNIMLARNTIIEEKNLSKTNGFWWFWLIFFFEQLQQTL